MRQACVVNWFSLEKMTIQRFSYLSGEKRVKERLRHSTRNASRLRRKVEKRLGTECLNTTTQKRRTVLWFVTQQRPNWYVGNKVNTRLLALLYIHGIQREAILTGFFPALFSNMMRCLHLICSAFNSKYFSFKFTCSISDSVSKPSTSY